MPSWLKTFLIYWIVIWNFILSLTVLILAIENGRLKITVGQIIQNQEIIADSISAVADNESVLLDLHKSNIEMYNNARAYLKRFHKEAEAIDQTRKLVEGCRNEDKANP